MDGGEIGGARDQAVKGVDLADQMALAEPAHGRVAGHRADLAREKLTRATDAPMRAAAAAASEPAWPPPTTMISKLVAHAARL